MQLQQASTLEEFKSWFYYGKWWPSIHRSWMRIGCSKLKYDLCFKLHVIEESSCDCGEEYEDCSHYFMEYPNYTELRLELFNAIAPYSDANIETILNGSRKLGINKNVAIIDAVHFITSKGRV